MVVFTHKCLPLTSNTKEPKNSNENSEDEGRDQFGLVLRTLVDSVRYGKSSNEEITWDYDYTSLWSPLLRDSRTGKRINIWKCSSKAYIGFIRTHTYWYKRLPRSGRNRVATLSETSRGRRFMKDVLDTCDGVVTSLIFGVPEMFLSEGYALSDRIINSVIMNCFHNYSRFQKDLKKWRKTIKYCALNEKETDEIGFEINSLRSMSYLVVPTQILNRTCKDSSKSKFFRVAMLCQTRATGLAGVGQVHEAIKDFLDTVSVKRPFNPNKLLSECIENVTSHLADELNYGLNAEFKISMSTSACRESGRQYEGKFGFLKQLVRDAEVTIPPLRDGIPGTLGNWLWNEAAIRANSNDPEILKVNVAAIRENGKSRIVTSGSFWKDTALQPFSHLSLNVIKNVPHLRDSLRAARHGWRFIDGVQHPIRDDTYEFVFGRTPVYLYTTDLTRATDIPPREGAWAVTGRLLEKIGFSQEVLSVVKKYWLSDKELYIGGKHVGTMRNGVPMGDPLTKTNLSLIHPICDLYARTRAECIGKEKGNGDDVAALSTSIMYAKYFREAVEGLGYEISELDEANSKSWGTYCEEWFHVPVSTANTCHHAMKVGKQMLLPYLDIPKIRIMIATSKDRVDFSSDPRGKVTLLGHDQEYAMRMKGPAENIYSIASAFQDVTLATVDRPEPLFLPRQVAGVGKAPPHWNVQSWKNIMKRCRPWHREYYLLMMKEFISGVTQLSGYRGVLKESNHFSKEMMVELYEIPLDDPIRDDIMVKSDQWELFPGNVLTKLITLGYLIPESKMTKYYLFQERLEQLEQDTHRDLFEVVKAKMIGVDFDPTEEEEIITKFRDLYKDSPYRINSDRTENLYACGAVLKLEQGNPLYVDLPGPIQEKFGRLPKPLSRYEAQGQELYDWFMDNGWQIINGYDYQLPPTDILEDDPIITQTVMSGGSDWFFIVTDDIRLVRLTANKSIYPVGRISVRDFNNALRVSYEGLSDERSDEENVDIMERQLSAVTHVDCKIIMDRGSIDTWFSQYHAGEDSNFVAAGIPWRKPVKSKYMEKEKFYGDIRTVPKYETIIEHGYPRKAFPWGYPALLQLR